MRRTELKGEKFGKLTVLERAGKNDKGKSLWRCKCECGKEKLCVTAVLNRGECTNCGCLVPGNAETLVGMRFDRLLVISLCPTRKDKGWRWWNCLCDCGKEVQLPTGRLTHNNTRSCGCLVKDTMRALNTIHGESNTYLHNLWIRINKRCNSPTSQDYPMYGARGIKVYPEWEREYLPFKNYVVTVLGDRPEKHTLDRIDNDKGYIPGNIRWASLSTQNQNRKYMGEIKFKGVTFYKQGAKHYKASIYPNDRSVHLGYFTTPEEAALAYNKAALELYGPDACLNKI